MKVRLGGMGVMFLSKLYSNRGALVIRIPHDAKYLWEEETRDFTLQPYTPLETQVLN